MAGDMSGEPLLLRFPHESREETRSVACALMASARQRPRNITAREMVPPDVHYDYMRRWQEEDRALLAAEAAAQPRGGRLRRALRILFGRA